MEDEMNRQLNSSRDEHLIITFKSGKLVHQPLLETSSAMIKSTLATPASRLDSDITVGKY